MNLAISLPGFHSCSQPGPVIATAAEVAEFWKAEVASAPQFNSAKEWTLLLFLDGDNRLLGHFLSSNGARRWVEFPPRGTLLGVVVTNAPMVCAVHNHPPQASLVPSPHDHKARYGLEYVLGRVDARLVDFCIVTPEGSSVLSFREMGFMGTPETTVEALPEDVLEIHLRGVLSAVRLQTPLIAVALADSAAATEQTEESYLGALLSEALNDRFHPPPLEDRWQWFAAAVFDAAGNKQLTLLKNVTEQARADGISVIELLRRKAIPALVAEFTRPVIAEENLDAPVDAVAPVSS